MTPEDAAQWMIDEMTEKGKLYQDKVARNLNKQDPSLVYKNKNRNYAIQKEVLDCFNKLGGKDVVWSRGDRCWRHRKSTDVPGRAQH
jgi:hypothetical protein